MRVEFYLHFPVRLHGVVFKQMATFTLLFVIVESRCHDKRSVESLVYCYMCVQ